MEYTDLMLKTIASAKSLHPYEWIKQREVIVKFIEATNRDYPDNFACNRIPIKSNVELIIIHFGFKNEEFLLFDVVIDNRIIECTSLEIIKKKSPKYVTEILWNSDPDSKVSYLDIFPLKLS